MANPEHVEVVRAGAWAVEDWRRRHGFRITLDLTGADLREVVLSSCDLRNSDFSRANLDGALLNDVACQHVKVGTRTDAGDYITVFRDATLRNACLIRTTADSAIFTSADLASARLSFADFSSAALDDANLSGADLTGVNLNFSKVTGTRFKNAIFGVTNLGSVDLSDADGLETALHPTPSVLGVETLRKCKGQIPESFLRGCGLSDEFIQYIPSLFGDSAFQFYSCFISYSHNDKQFARQLHDRLQGKGIRCWLDEHQLNPGDDIYERVDRGIRVWDKVLLCCSDASLSSWWVKREIDTAIEKEAQFEKERGEQILKIIPLNLDGSLFEWEGSHAATLRKRLAADFTDWKSDADKFEREFEKVVRALRTDGGGSVEPVGRL